MIIRFFNIRKPLIKIVFSFIFSILMYFMFRFFFIINGLPKKYFSVEYKVLFPVNINSGIVLIEFNNYYLNNILPKFKNYGINFETRIEYPAVIYNFNFSFTEKVLSLEEISNFDTMVRKGLESSYANALKTDLYYNYLNKLYAIQKQTNATVSYYEVYKKFLLGDEEVKKMFPAQTPKFEISGPNVRTIKNLNPLLRELILMIVSILTGLSFLFIWMAYDQRS